MKLLKYRSVRLASLFIVLFTCANSFFSYFFQYLLVESTEELFRNIKIFLGIIVLLSLLLYLEMKLRKVSRFYLGQDMKQRNDKYLISLSKSEYGRVDYGQRLSAYINDVDKVLDLWLDRYFNMIECAFMALFSFIALTRIHYLLSLLTLALVIIISLVSNLFKGKLQAYTLSVQKAKEVYLSKMRELLQGHDTFLENGAGPAFLSKSREKSYTYEEENLKAGTFAAEMSGALTLVNCLMTVASLGLVSYLVIQGDLPTGVLLSTINLIPSFGSGLIQFFSERQFYKSGQKLFEEKFEDSFKESYQEESFLKSFRGGREIVEVTFEEEKEGARDISSIEMENVVVSYPERKVALPQDFSLKQGEKVALVGKSGSGKSSLLKVITGEVSNFEGRLLINGRDCREGDIFQALSYVNQDTFLFNETIRYNLDLSESHRDSEIREVLDLLDLGALDLDSKIEDNGKNLSGGQRQRLSIGRAILRGKKLMLLDEPTSSLDKKTAEKIEGRLLDEVESLILVSHNLSDSAKKRLDRIVEMEEE